MIIAEDDVCRPDVVALLEAHLDLMRSTSPPEAVHALDLEALTAPMMTFWTVRESGVLLACGALKQLDPTHGELKSMHTSKRHRGRGIAGLLVQHMLNIAQARGYRHLSLETGATDDFAAAHRLYERFGFAVTGPFGNYAPHSFSRFMTRAI